MSQELLSRLDGLVRDHVYLSRSEAIQNAGQEKLGPLNLVHTMTFLPILLCLARTGHFDVAYCARYYFQGKRTSYRHLYVCFHDGSGRRQLTFGQKETLGCIWVDKNHIAYAELNGFIPDSYSVGARHWTGRIAVMDVRTGSPRTLKKITVTDAWAGSNQESRELTIDNRCFRISSQRAIELGKEDPYGGRIFGEQTGGDDDSRMDANLRDPHGRLSYTLSWNVTITEPRGVLKVDIGRNHEWKSFHLVGGTIGWAKPEGADSVYVLTEPIASRTRCDSFFYMLNFKNHTVKILVSEVGNLIVDPEHNIWLGSQQAMKPLAELRDHRQVWVGWLYGGDWKTNRRFTIAEGLVSVWPFQLRPN